MILLILSPISLSPLSATMSAKPPPLGTSISAPGACRLLVRDVLHEQQREDVVLVLRGVHAAAQFVAALPEGAVELGFLQGHLISVFSAVGQLGEFFCDNVLAQLWGPAAERV